MPPPAYFNSREILALLEAKAAATDLPDGSVQVEKAGLVGVRPTLEAACLDWLCWFRELITRPKPAAP